MPKILWCARTINWHFNPSLNLQSLVNLMFLYLKLYRDYEWDSYWMIVYAFWAYTLILSICAWIASVLSDILFHIFEEYLPYEYLFMECAWHRLKSLSSCLWPWCPIEFVYLKLTYFLLRCSRKYVSLQEHL